MHLLHTLFADAHSICGCKGTAFPRIEQILRPKSDENHRICASYLLSAVLSLLSYKHTHVERQVDDTTVEFHIIVA